jgi:hypothetical protein
MRVVLALIGLLALADTAQLLAQLRFKLDIAAKRLSLEELSRVIPALDSVNLPPGFQIDQLDVSGPLGNMEITFAGHDGDSRVSGKLLVDLRAPERRVQGVADFANVDAGRWLGQPALPPDVTANVEFDLRLSARDGRTVVNGTYAVRSPDVSLAGYRATSVRAHGRVEDRTITIAQVRARAYSAAIDARGRMTFPEGDAGTRYAFDGTVAGLDLRRLPRSMRAPAIASDVTAGFHVSGAGPAMSGRAQLSPSTIAGAAVGGGTVLEFGLSDAGFRYAARGAVRGLDLQQVAHGLGIDARASNRFSSAIAGRFDVEGTRDRLVGASIVLTDSRLFGASVPAATVRAAETPEGWQFGVDGQFTALDLAAFGAGAKDDGALAGHLNVSGSVTGLDDGFEVSSDLAVEGRVTPGPERGGRDDDRGRRHRGAAGRRRAAPRRRPAGRSRMAGDGGRNVRPRPPCGDRCPVRREGRAARSDWRDVRKATRGDRFTGGHHRRCRDARRERVVRRSASRIRRDRRLGSPRRIHRLSPARRAVLVHGIGARRRRIRRGRGPDAHRRRRGFGVCGT